MAKRSSPAAGIASIPNTATPAQDSPSSAPRQWWQWLLLYPTLLIALLTAVPEWIKLADAWKSNVPPDQLRQAEQQKELWEKNLQCTTKPMDFFQNPDNVKVVATICDSGDVFVRVFAPGNKNAYYWVDVEGLLKTASYPELLATAEAASGPPILNVQAENSFVMCQRFLD